MPLTAKSILRRVVDTLQDTTSVRWPIAELVRYLNDGQREILVYRPDALNVTSTLTLATGARQTLPANGAKLLDVIRNTSGTKRAVRQVDKQVLDAQVPAWQSMTAASEIVHFMYDARDPRTFYVYPPATSSASLEIVYAKYPTDITEPAADGAIWSDVTGDISLADTYGNALADYVLARAYSKDADYTANLQRAAGHYNTFANALGVELKGTVGVAPKQSAAAATVAGA